MHHLRRIIVGHDLRATGDTALNTAALIASTFNADLRLVHVIEPLNLYRRVSHPLASPETIEGIAQRIGEKLRSLAESPKLAHLKVEYEVRKGKPFAELIIARRAWQADLLVVGGTSNEHEFLGSSTAQGVVRKALVPVLMCKKALRTDSALFLVPTDFSSCAKRAAQAALTLARALRGRVIFLHVLNLYPTYAVTYADEVGVSVPLPRPLPGDLDREWQEFLTGLALEKVAWEKMTCEGDPATVIAQQGRINRAELIVMGTHGRTGLQYMLLGSVTRQVVRLSDQSVLTIRPEAFQFELP